MNIIVCIKQVPDTTEIKIDPVTNTLIREGVQSIINPFDMYAIEEGVRLKERLGGKVTVLTMGPPQAEAVLREAMSMGERTLRTDTACVSILALVHDALEAQGTTNKHESTRIEKQHSNLRFSQTSNGLAAAEACLARSRESIYVSVSFRVIRGQKNKILDHGLHGNSRMKTWINGLMKFVRPFDRFPYALRILIRADSCPFVVESFSRRQCSLRKAITFA